MPPKVSVGVPFYNSETCIEKCARSLFAQDLREMEFVFVDDASTDDGRSVVERVLAEFPERSGQVRIIRHPGNLGPGAARRHAFEQFTGEYIIFCDADDFVDPRMYSTMFRKAKDADADVVHCGYDVLDTSGKMRILDTVEVSDIRQYRRMINDTTITPFMFTHMFRRSIVAAGEVYAPDFIRYSEDLLTIAQLLRRCEIVACCPEALYHYIRNPGSICHTNKSRNMRNLRHVLRYLDRTERDAEILEARKTYWRNLGFRALRYGTLSVGLAAALARRCRSGVLGDRRLKLKKRLRLAAVLYFPRLFAFSKKKKK